MGARFIFSSTEPKAHWWAYGIGRPPSSIHPSVVCRPHSLNTFSSETTGPIEVKFHVESPWDGGTKVCHMIKMATMPIYMTLKLSMQHRVLEYYQVCSNADPGLTMTYFTARSNLVPCAFVQEKGKTMNFSETVVVYDLKLATDDQSDKKFLLT